jgi:hypothetical protein
MINTVSVIGEQRMCEDETRLTFITCQMDEPQFVVHRRPAGIPSYLRRRPSVSSLPDVWVKGKPSVADGERVQVIAREAEFVWILCQEGEGYVRITYLNDETEEEKKIATTPAKDNDVSSLPRMCM